VALLAVYLDDHAELRIGEVDPRNELAAVVHLELGDCLREAGAS
jgi:hypothetical protein